ITSAASWSGSVRTRRTGRCSRSPGCRRELNMVGRLAGMTVAVVGGDRREHEICRLAVRADGIVRAYGIPVPASGLAGVTWCDALDEALADAEFCLLPL